MFTNLFARGVRVPSDGRAGVCPSLALQCVTHFTRSCPNTVGSCSKVVTSCCLAVVFLFGGEPLSRKSWTACFHWDLVFLWHLERGMSISGLWTAEPCLAAAAPWAVRGVGLVHREDMWEGSGPWDQCGHVTFLRKGRQRASRVLPCGRVRVLGAPGGGGKAGGVQARCPPQQHRMPQDPAP